MSTKKQRFKLFDTQRVGKGINKSDVEKTPGFKKFWRIYRENFFNRLFYVNIIMILGNLPAIFWIMALAGVGQAEYLSPNDSLFSVLYGVGEYTVNTPGSLAMAGVSGVQTLTFANTFVSYLFWGLGALTFLTWGFVNAGAAYVLRNMATERPIFMLSDFIDMIKKNWKQSLPFGIIDLAILILLPFNIYSIITGGNNFLLSIFFWVTILVTLIYIVMRWYIYLQIVSFKMKITKIIKNSLYFVLLGIKRNIFALLGNILLVALVLVFLFIFPQLAVLSLFIPALLLFSNSSFMGYYAAWYKIEEIMVIHDTDKNENVPTDDTPDEISDQLESKNEA